MQNINPVEVLKLGVIGLVFLLAWLAYILLRKEQAQEKPRKGASDWYMGVDRKWQRVYQWSA